MWEITLLVKPGCRVLTLHLLSWANLLVEWLGSCTLGADVLALQQYEFLVRSASHVLGPRLKFKKVKRGESLS